jgi:hypothetical protein
VTFLFRIVRDEVMKETNGTQQPFVYGSLSKEAIYLTPPTGDQRLATMPNIAPETRPTNPLFTADDAKRVDGFAHDKRFNMPVYQIDAIDADVPESFKTFLGVWVSRIGSDNGVGRQDMLIVSNVDKDGVASGYIVYGPPTAKTWNKNPSSFQIFKAKITGGILRVQSIGNKEYEVTFKSLDQGRVSYQPKLGTRVSFNTLYPVWRLVDAAAGKHIADAALSAPLTREELEGTRTREEPRSTKPVENGPRFGSKTGEVSNGNCRCKTLCDSGQSRFSAGRSVGECKAQCQVAFSGCTRGELRSNARRD